MCVMSSEDGYLWGNLDFAAYAPAGIWSSSARMVYGHYWVPKALYAKEGAIPYLFSIWKSPLGYFDDFFFDTTKKCNIPAQMRFPNYNTKMYLYWP